MQQGDGGRESAMASISVKGADSKSVWEASSLYVNSGGTAALSLSDSVITGVGGFFPAADYDETPIYRSKAVAKEFNDGAISGLFAGTPPLEALRSLVSEAGTISEGGSPAE